MHEATSTEESNYALVRGFSTLQQNVSVRLQNISSHLKRDVQITGRASPVPIEMIAEDECVQLKHSKSPGQKKSKQEVRGLPQQGTLCRRASVFLCVGAICIGARVSAG